MSVLAFALGGVALIGVPPSGAYLAKELLLQAAAETEQWWWAVVIQAGGIFTSSYLLLVLAHALAPASEPVRLRAPVPRMREAAALALALCSLLLGLVPWEAYLSVPAASPVEPARPQGALDGALADPGWRRAGGLAGALGASVGAHTLAEASLVAMVGPARRTALTLGRMIERVDGVLRQWPAAALPSWCWRSSSVRRCWRPDDAELVTASVAGIHARYKSNSKGANSQVHPNVGFTHYGA